MDAMVKAQNDTYPVQELERNKNAYQSMQTFALFLTTSHVLEF
jgi:hypothetical protein